MYENFGWKSPSDNVGKEFYPLEYDRWHFFNIVDRYYVYRCELEDEFDPRYTDISQGQLFYREKLVQERSGVFDILE